MRANPQQQQPPRKGAAVPDWKECWWSIGSSDQSVRISAIDRLLGILSGIQKTQPVGRLAPATDETVCHLCKTVASNNCFSREASALVLTRLLHDLPESLLPSDRILSLAPALPTRASVGAVSAPDTKVVGHALCLTAICRSGRGGTSALAGKMVGQLVQACGQFPFVRGLCSEAAIAVIQSADVREVGGTLFGQLAPFLNVDKGEDLLPEVLAAAFALELRGGLSSEDLDSDRWCAGGLACSGNLKRVKKALKKVAVGKGQAPTVWALAVDAVLAIADATERRKSLESLWAMAEECGPSLPLKLLPKVLAKVAPSSVQAVLSKRVLDQMSSKQSEDAPMAREEIVKAATTRAELVVPLLEQLRKYGRKIDMQDKNKIIPKIAVLLSAPQVTKYLPTLFKMFADAGGEDASAFEDGEGAPEFSGAVHFGRVWCAQQIEAVASCKTAEQDDVMKALKFLAFHAAFTSSVSSPSETEPWLSPVSPPVSSKTRSALVSRLCSLLFTLHTALGPAASEDARPRPKGGMQEKGVRCLEELYGWERRTLEKHKPARPVSQELLEAQAKAGEVVKSLRKRIAGSEDGDRKAVERMGAFCALLLQVGTLLSLPAPAQAVDEDDEDAEDTIAEAAPEEILGIVTDLDRCQDFIANPADAVKVVEDDMSDDDKPEKPVDVVIDVLLSVLARQSRLMRMAVHACFKGIARFVPRQSLASFISVIADDRPLDVEHDEGHDHDHEDEDPDMEEIEENEEDANDEVKGEVKEEKEGEGEEGDEDEDDDEAMDEDDDDLDMDEHEEELAEFDKKMSRYFREKNVQKQVVTQNSQFHNKVAHLLKIFVSENETNPAVVSLVDPILRLRQLSSRTPGSIQLSKILDALVEDICKCRVSSDGVPQDELLEMSKEARKLVSRYLPKTVNEEKKVSSMLSSVVAFSLRTLFHASPNCPEFAAESPDTKIPRAKRLKEEQHVAAILNHPVSQEMAKLVLPSLLDSPALHFARRKLHWGLHRYMMIHRSVSAEFFDMLLRKVPQLAWDLAPHILIQYPAAKKHASRIHGIRLIVDAFNYSKGRQDLDNVAPLRILAPLVAQAVEFCADSGAKNPGGVVEEAKYLAQLCKLMHTVLGRESATTALKVDDVLPKLKAASTGKNPRQAAKAADILRASLTGEPIRPAQQQPSAGRSLRKQEKNRARMTKFLAKKAAEAAGQAPDQKRAHPTKEGADQPPKKKRAPEIQSAAAPEAESKLVARAEGHVKSKKRAGNKKKTELKQ